MEFDMRRNIALVVAILVAGCATAAPSSEALIDVHAPAGYVISMPRADVDGGVLSVRGAVCAGASPTIAPPHTVVLVSTTVDGGRHRFTAPLHGGPLSADRQSCAFFAQAVGPVETLRSVSICAGEACS